MTGIPLPGATHRTAVIGRTGSGKTQFAVWLLSCQSLAARPWLIIDYKRDSLIGELGAREVGLGWRPSGRGLHIVHPLPGEDDEVEELLWRVWKKGNCGVYIDEGHLVPNQDAFAALLVTGRSRKIPMIVLSQRPVIVPRFVFSEASFICCFPLNDRRDQLTVEGFAPIDTRRKLPRFWSSWYDVENNLSYILRPVPDALILTETIRAVPPRGRWSLF